MNQDTRLERAGKVHDVRMPINARRYVMQGRFGRWNLRPGKGKTYEVFEEFGSEPGHSALAPDYVPPSRGEVQVHASHVTARMWVLAEHARRFKERELEVVKQLVESCEAELEQLHQTRQAVEAERQDLLDRGTRRIMEDHPNQTAFIP